MTRTRCRAEGCHVILVTMASNRLCRKHRMPLSPQDHRLSDWINATPEYRGRVYRAYANRCCGYGARRPW
jgi:hypothetical protein